LLFDNHFDLFNSLVNALNPNPTKSWFSIWGHMSFLNQANRLQYVGNIIKTSDFSF
jgi:hypothetical protein